MSAVTDRDLLGQAWESVRVTASLAAVTIRLAATLPELQNIANLCADVWGADPACPPVRSELLRALAHAGNYVAGAFADDGQVVGACVGFFGPPAARTLHSHLAAVSTSRRGSDVGFALKLHQRAWALQAGVDAITWTFDPLIRRNAYFNVVKLGTDLEGYLPDFYGARDDALNRGAPSDRLLVRWRLGAEKVLRACGGQGGKDPRRVVGVENVVPVVLKVGELAGAPVVDATWESRNLADGPRAVVIAIPPDIEAMRVSVPDLAEQWRQAVRGTLGELLAAGWSVSSLDTRGRYVCERAPTPP